MKKILSDLRLLAYGLLPYVKLAYFIASIGIFLCLLSLSIEKEGWYEFLFIASGFNLFLAYVVVKDLADEN